jgi:hypothetical protein
MVNSWNSRMGNGRGRSRCTGRLDGGNIRVSNSRTSCRRCCGFLGRYLGRRGSRLLRWGRTRRQSRCTRRLDGGNNRVSNSWASCRRCCGFLGRRGGWLFRWLRGNDLDLRSFGRRISWFFATTHVLAVGGITGTAGTDIHTKQWFGASVGRARDNASLEEASIVRTEDYTVVWITRCDRTIPAQLLLAAGFRATFRCQGTSVTSIHAFDRAG